MSCNHEFYYDGATSGNPPTCGKCGAVKDPSPTPHVPNPEHDSIFQRFEQLQALVQNVARTAQLERRPNIAVPAFEALTLLGLLRAQVLK